MPTEQLNPYFDSLRDRHREFRAVLAAADISPLSACLRFVLEQPQVDHLVVGINQLREFKEIISALTDTVALPELFQFALQDEAMVSPAQWKLVS